MLFTYPIPAFPVVFHASAMPSYHFRDVKVATCILWFNYKNINAVSVENKDVRSIPSQKMWLFYETPIFENNVTEIIITRARTT